MPRKALDSRIPTLIQNGILEKKRTFFVIVGDRAKDVIVNLHYIMSNYDVKQNRSVLWAYKNKLLGFTSHRKKRELKIKKEVKRGIRDANTEDPFELFVSLHDIRYVYYKETEKILGNTFGMCILQDFEAITPNLLARTIETVEGGGLVLILLKGMNSLKQLYTMSMDVHSRYRTEAHGDVVARFNERFILSLGSCESCLVIDDELNVLPISGGKNAIAVSPPDPDEKARSPAALELQEIKKSVEETKPTGSLVQISKTADQAKALLTFVQAITEKTLRSTVALTAARGRGKSAALGVAVAAAVAFGYSNIFITSPSPENLKTLFEFLFKGFDALEYLDHTDYTILQSTNPDFNKAIVRVNVHRNHRQTIQYIQPQDAHVLGQAELLVIDEAAAIPLPLVQKLLGPYLVFMASTINGYEGTGRSLSLKLLSKLRDQSRGVTSRPDKPNGKEYTNGDNDGTARGIGTRSLREITLSEPIRYATGDPVEKWLHRLLCLDSTLPSARATLQGTPHPTQCQLLAINRDTLFSFHPISEKFLQQILALYVASHYKNSPNDLQLMSDAPSHQLYVLVPPVDDNANRLPEPLCVLQVALEGQISRQSVLNSLNRGQRAAGDLIPWLVSQQFQDDEFAGLSGARIVRIATNPEYMNMGYGSRALQLLIEYYEGKHTSLTETDTVPATEMVRVTDEELREGNLLNDDVKVRDIRAMPSLFARLSELRPERLDYIGTSFGLTSPLHNFWKRAGFAPVYLRQTANDLTGEHSCIMIRGIQSDDGRDPAWLGAFARDFRRRFLSLLSFQFRDFPALLALSIEESARRGADLDPSYVQKPLSKADLDAVLSPFDLKRLESYADNMLDYHVILDLIPFIAALHFDDRLAHTVKFSGVQTSILLAIGLQRKTLESIEKELGLGMSQVLAMFVKLIRKVATGFKQILTRDAMELDGKRAAAPIVSRAEASGLHDDEAVVEGLEPLQGVSLDEELAQGGKQEAQNLELRAKQRELIDALPLDRYRMEDGDEGWGQAESVIRKGVEGGSTVVSVKAAKRKQRDGRDGGDGDGDGVGKRNMKGGVTMEKVYDEEMKIRERKKVKREKDRKGR